MKSVQGATGKCNLAIRTCGPYTAGDREISIAWTYQEVEEDRYCGNDKADVGEWSPW